MESLAHTDERDKIGGVVTVASKRADCILRTSWGRLLATAVVLVLLLMLPSPAWAVEKDEDPYWDDELVEEYAVEETEESDEPAF